MAKHFTDPHDALRHHVSGAIERGEREAITEVNDMEISRDKIVGGHQEMVRIMHRLDVPRSDVSWRALRKIRRAYGHVSDSIRQWDTKHAAQDED